MGKEYKVVEYNQIFQAILKFVTNPQAIIKVCDMKYRLPIKEDIRRFLSKDGLNNRTYKKDFFDCDDYSIVLLGRLREWKSGLACGIVHVETNEGRHALNFFIDDQLTFWYIEPQNDNIFRAENYKPYFILI